jgi:ATP-binding cassette subfamily B protein
VNAARPDRRLRRALAFALPFRRTIYAIIVLTLAVAAVNAGEPLVLKLIFDELGGGRDPAIVLRAVAALAALALLRELGGAISNWLTWQARLGIHFKLLGLTVDKLHRMPLRQQRSEGVGAIMTRLDRGIQGFITAVTQLLFNVFPALVYLGLSLLIMMQLDWRLTLIVLGFTPLPVIVAAIASPEQIRRERTLLDRWAQIYSRFNEVLSGITTVRSFAMEGPEQTRFLHDVAEANAVVERGVRLDSRFAAIGNLIVALARIAAIAAGAWLILRNYITVGTIVAMLSYLSGLFGPVQSLTGIYQSVQRASASLDEIFGILDVTDLVTDAPDAAEAQHVQGAVEFDHVTFRYDPGGRALLNGLSLRVAPGETVAIVGPSGSGKTTMMSLLMRFHDPVAGAIRLDGVDLRKLKQHSVRRQIGVVLQDPLLFNDTIFANIAYGWPRATMAEVEAAARAANAHEFIRRLPDGYQTMVGERGGLLSVGERQRLTIARALIKNPRLIILDEATSSLDAESEGLVQEAINQLMQGRTTFVIAHRLATVVNATRIIVLKEGHIAESGSHRELLRAGGYYAELVRRQIRGLIENENEPLVA